MPQVSQWSEAGLCDFLLVDSQDDVKVLLEHGVDPSIKYAGGSTAADFVIEIVFVDDN
jgi:hypothetical protein